MTVAGSLDLAELTDGKGVYLASPVPADLAGVGYVEQEFTATGTATAYRPAGPLSSDGRWSFEPAGTAPYRTRIVVRRPAAPADLSGVAIVEWLNVSSGHDSDTGWAAATRRSPGGATSGLACRRS